MKRRVKAKNRRANVFGSVKDWLRVVACVAVSLGIFIGTAVTSVRRQKRAEHAKKTAAMSGKQEGVDGSPRPKVNPNDGRAKKPFVGRKPDFGACKRPTQRGPLPRFDGSRVFDPSGPRIREGVRKDGKEDRGKV